MKDTQIESLIPLRWRSPCGRYAIEIRRCCLAEMLHKAVTHYPREFGGPMYGRYSSDGRRAVALGMVPPPVDSRSSPCSFVRGVLGLTDFFRDLFTRSEGRTHYVGEWHSHPGGSPQPSSVDWETLQSVAEDPAMGCPEIILIIVGGHLAREPRLGVFVHSRDNGRIVLSPISQTGGESERPSNAIRAET